MSNTKIAPVTGASSGFGQLTAARLAVSGYRVFGTSRKAQTSSASGVEMLVLDVRSDESTQTCVAELMQRADRLDLLVNNAGQTHASLAEETDPAQARDVMETTSGCSAVTNAGAHPDSEWPHHQREFAGGATRPPGQAFYSASKFAVLEGYTEALSIELQPFHIHVTLIEPVFQDLACTCPRRPQPGRLPTTTACAQPSRHRCTGR